MPNANQRTPAPPGSTLDGSTQDPGLHAVPAALAPADSETIFLPEDAPDAAAEQAPASARTGDVSVRPVPMHPGELLSGTRFRLVRWLGDGGMGTVFEAVHVDLERSVALKVLRSVRGKRSLSLFRQEAKTLGRLGSRFVVDVHDFVELRDGRLVIAMELLRGETLREVIKRGPLPIERIIPIARQLCKGLSAAHRVGVVHRDVKPENISLEVFEGRGDAVKLLDFGIAQMSDDAEISRAGTPGYLAPEVFSGVGADRRSDLYALGCTLYELAAGRKPFEDDDPSKVLLAHLDTKPVRLGSIATVPDGFSAAVMRCLEKDPEKRFESAADLEVALCEAQIAANFTTPWDDLPLPSVQPEVVERLRRQMPTLRRSRKRRWVPIAVAGLVAVAAAGVWTGYAMKAEEAADTPRLAEVDALVEGARGAAARAFFVYPPPEDPTLTTAFGFVVQLEEWTGPGGDVAAERATRLRAEFADTLERLGDRYWEAEGGKPFALDYYAEALVFEPERSRARVRASMTPGELRLLRSKAKSGGFSDVELAEVEPLIVLSDVPQEDKDARMQSIQTRSPQAAKRKRQLDSLARGGAKGSGADAEPSAVADVTEDSPLLLEEPDVGTLDDSIPEDEPNPQRARELTSQADRAHRRGQSARAEALYSEALALDRRHADAYRGLGRVAFDRGSYALAGRQLSKGVRLAPRNARMRIELGDALYKSFDYDGARAQYRRAQELGSSEAAGRLAKVGEKR